MEIAIAIHARVHITAKLDDAGVLTAKAFAQTDYAPGMTVTAEADVPEEHCRAIQLTMHNALDAVKTQLATRVERAKYKAIEISVAKGEL